MADWFGTTWADVGWVVASTVAFYVTTFAAVRIAGRRTLTQLSAFDVLVTIALGSLLATTVVSDDPSYARGAAALLTLLGLQVGFAWLRMKIPVLRRVLEFPPEELLAEDGSLDLPSSPLSAQLTEEEVMTALRQAGIFDRSQVSVIILEPTGKLSFKTAPDGGADADPSDIPDDQER